MPRLTNAERASRSRSALVAAAAAVFNREGYHGASMSAIVAEAELTKGAAYFHFASKEALAAAVVEAHYERWPPLIREVAAEGRPPLESLVELVYRVGRAFRDDPVVRAGARLSAERRDIPTRMPTPFVGWTDQIAQLLADARDRGELAPDVDVDATARVLVAAFFGIQAVSDALACLADIESRLDDLWALLLPRLAAGRPTETRTARY